jgi:hypothetical protein
MALADVDRRVHIDAVVETWRERCLLEDGSLLQDSEELWKTDNLDRAYHNIAEEPLPPSTVRVGARHEVRWQHQDWRRLVSAQSVWPAPTALRSSARLTAT